VAYWLSNNKEIIDLGWPWRSLTTSTVGYPSYSWASCFLHLMSYKTAHQLVLSWEIFKPILLSLRIFHWLASWKL